MMHGSMKTIREGVFCVKCTNKYTWKHYLFYCPAFLPTDKIKDGSISCTDRENNALSGKTKSHGSMVHSSENPTTDLLLAMFYCLRLREKIGFRGKVAVILYDNGK